MKCAVQAQLHMVQVRFQQPKLVIGLLERIIFMTGLVLRACRSFDAVSTKVFGHPIHKVRCSQFGKEVT
jgi:hypothetical protein